MNESKQTTEKQNEELVTWVIEIDCPPGFPRPSDLLPRVLEGTGLNPVEKSSAFFGNFTFYIEGITKEQQEKASEIVGQRLRTLDANGTTRYASWGDVRPYDGNSKRNKDEEQIELLPKVDLTGLKRADFAMKIAPTKHMTEELIIEILHYATKGTGFHGGTWIQMDNTYNTFEAEFGYNEDANEEHAKELLFTNLNNMIDEGKLKKYEEVARRVFDF